MTDAITAASAARTAITGALKKASESTGVGFDYLYRVAVRESSLNPQATAKTSSAAGLFQFIEQTWLQAVKTHGARHGLGGYAADITAGPDGRLAVADPGRRREILDLRFDADKAAALAGELARDNKASLEGALGRAVDAAELYAAHFLGAGGAKKLLSAHASDSAAALLPGAADANRHVFYDGARARTVGEVIDGFRRTIGGAGERLEKALPAALRETAAALLSPSRAAAAMFAPYTPDAMTGGFDGSGAFSADLRDRASFAPVSPLAGLEFKSLSPLVLAVLQAFEARAPSDSDRE